MYLNRGIRPFLAPVRGGVAATAAAAVAAAGFSVGVAFGLASVTGALLRWGDGGAPAVAGALAATAACAAGRGVCLWVRDQLATATAARVKRAVRARVMDRIYELGPGHTWPRGRGGVQPTAVDGVEHLQGYIGFYLPQLLVSWAVPAVLLAVLVAVSPPVAAVVLVCVLTVPFAQRLWRLVLRDRARDHWDRFEAFADRVGDTVRGLPTLVALGAADRRRAHLAGAAEDLRAATTANMRASLGVSAVMNAAMSVGTAGATLTAALEASRGSLPLESVLLVLFLSAECFRPQQELSGYWHEGFHGIAAAGAITRLLETEPPVRDRPGAAPAEWAGPPSVAFENVDFTFPGAAGPALRGVSFAVPAGSVLAVVGASGAGKTTLGRLLLRDMDPDSGRVLLQGRDLADLSLSGLRRGTARVAQDVVLLSGTIRENIALAAGPPGPEADARVADAVARARVDDVAGQLDDGLDSAVGEGGRLLSGGQRQRVALARALAADARLLLLDEATSALDAENEALITGFLRAGRGERTMVVIAHRLSTVAHADLVLVLDRGRVAEFGPPGELALGQGHWARLVDAQRAGTGGVR
ncbi:ATP-binding cassette domain-containing protein [Nocardiopsis changdeensis]|uniref:ATP-binding cassette domain-containing protein n=1 Tax=Nocardiopsis changdeensis TaxID=2831969 RepID=A0ABX8BWW5_9ACTN|nr:MULTISPECIES: ATP-binding cassette domain-containing protein [Nocardiopsis]QUX25288.1 ATP-binding cassette domain-containing protein [Nocardiopsis changdeensis]QYX35675.1 ATP-binding cassette domain-containing protein [Nocardiopsis sp. MT53]